MKTIQHGRGTVRTVKNRAGKVLGYQALLPRHLSKPPRGVQRPDRYQEPVGGLYSTPEEARDVLDIAIVELQAGSGDMRLGLPFGAYVQQVIQALLIEELREHNNEARANKAISTFKSVDKTWLKKAPFYTLPLNVIEPMDLQRYFEYLRDKARGRSGRPLSGSFIRHISNLVTMAFDRGRVMPNPMSSVDLPPKRHPDVRFLDIRSQERFFRAETESLSLESQIMVGCGMGAGLRVGELLSMEVADVRLESADPHLIVRYGGPHHAPTKGRKVRRVELFEPGLGFWNIWMRSHYRGGRLVFAGKLSGYRKHWPDQFRRWGDDVGLAEFTSHIMRHTYAVSMLSGTWGYDPVGLEFVQEQLGHAERQTTERYYGAFEVGTWQREVRRMTGREARPAKADIVTAIRLLGACGPDGVGGDNSAQNKLPYLVGIDSRHPPKSLVLSRGPREPSEFDAATHQPLDEAAESVIRRYADGDPTAPMAALDVLRRVVEEKRAARAEAYRARSGGNRA